MDARGNCSCGWRGLWRTSNTDAHLDVLDHCKATGICDPHFNPSQMEPTETNSNVSETNPTEE